ncbi:MAG: hypothetical protein IKP49_06740 [Treponema sp.]|nr:hypothetical protein [Treponema sp.]
MSIIEQILKFSKSINSKKYSDYKIHKLLKKAVNPILKLYIKGNKQHQSLFERNENIERLIILRCFAWELWNLIINGELRNDIYGRRINVIEAALLRCEIATDENIVLLKNGQGLSVMSNLRLMLESFVVSKYLWEKGESEAKRFQDYMEFQKSDFEGSTLKLEAEYDESFFKAYGWISDKKFHSLSALVKGFTNGEYEDLFKISNNYIHATPYSLEKVWELNHQLQGYFPIDLPSLINLNERLLSDFLVFVTDCFIDTDKKESCKVVLEVIAKWI